MNKKRGSNEDSNFVKKGFITSLVLHFVVGFILLFDWSIFKSSNDSSLPVSYAVTITDSISSNEIERPVEKEEKVETPKKEVKPESKPINKHEELILKSKNDLSTPTFTPTFTPAPVKTATLIPTKAPTNTPTNTPVPVSPTPTKVPTLTPTKKPTKAPTKLPTKVPTKKPTSIPIPTATKKIVKPTRPPATKVPPTKIPPTPRPTLTATPKPVPTLVPTLTAVPTKNVDDEYNKVLEKYIDRGGNQQQSQPNQPSNQELQRQQHDRGINNSGYAGGVQSGNSSGSGNPNAVQKSAEFFNYQLEIKDTIRRYWRWYDPTTQLNAEVRMKIEVDGSISYAGIARSSGNNEFDASVIRAIRAADPLPPPPSQYYQDFRDVVILFSP